MDVVLANGRVMTNGGLADGLAVRLSGDRIVAVGSCEEVAAGALRRDLNGALLLPGFFDIQVNGGGGVLFNEAPTVETIATIGAAHRRFGTTSFLPTLISDDLEVVRAALSAVRLAIGGRADGVMGIHIEGPFLSPRRKGIHEAGKIRRMDDSAVDLLSSLGVGRTLVTLAPEVVSTDSIARLAGAGVVVAAGHTNASYAATRAALDHGLTGFTHLFNAMPPLASREPGVVGAALEDPGSWCSLIVDGHHVDPVTLRLALRCKPISRMILVTDAMAAVGTDDVTFRLQGKTIRVRGGVCVDEHGTLAGSDLDMAGAVRNAVQMLGVSLAEASRMASGNPAAFMGVADEVGRIAPGLRADLVLLDDRLEVLETWVAGRPSTPTDGAGSARR